MGNPREPFEPDVVYHVYNHGNGDDLIFREKGNYHFFLKKFRKYIPPIASVYAYCLMPNHFHFLIRIHPEKVLTNFFHRKSPTRDTQDLKNVVDLVSNQFKNFLISYSKAFNKKYDRRGSLFWDNIQRKPVENDDYFTNMIRYVHFNPVLHGFVKHPLEWEFSSIHSFQSKKENLICIKEVLDWFGGIEQFQLFHKSIQRDEIEKIKYLFFE